MKTMEGIDGKTAGHPDYALRAGGYSNLSPRTEQNPDLIQLFSLDLVSCQRLSKEEEYILARRTQTAWRNLLATLHEQQRRLAAILNTTESLTVDDQLSEPEVLRYLHSVQAYIRRSPQQESASNPTALQIWLEQVKEQLTCFRLCRDEMVRRNLRLVVMLARRYQNRGVGLLDLVQEGALGLMRAVEKFDPERKVAFSSYAVWWIRQGFSRAFLHREEATCSVDAPLDEDARNVLINLLIDPEAVSPEEEILKIDEAHGLRQALSILPPLEAEIVRLRFGLADDKAHTYEEIGLRLHLSREQVRLWEQRALLRLKHQLRPAANGPVGRQKPLRRKSALLHQRWTHVAEHTPSWRQTA